MTSSHEHDRLEGQWKIYGGVLVLYREFKSPILTALVADAPALMQAIGIGGSCFGMLPSLTCLVFGSRLGE